MKNTFTILLGYFLVGSLLLFNNLGLAQTAYIANFNDDNVTVINTADNTVVETIPVGNGPFGVVASPNGAKVYVSNFISADVSVINTFNNSVEATISVGSQANGIAISPDGSKVFVASRNAGEVAVINTLDNSIITTLQVGSGPNGIAMSPDGQKVYVADFSPSVVYIINTQDYSITSFAAGFFPSRLALSPDGSKLYVTNNQADNLRVINTDDLSTLANVPVGDAPMDVVVSPDGTKVYVGNSDSGSVTIINADDNSVAATISVGASPFGLSFNQDGSKIFVVNNNSDNVSVIDTDDQTVLATIPVGDEPYGFGSFVSPYPVAFTLQSQLCANEGLQTSLGGGSPVGGIYSGLGVVDDGNGETFTFDPDMAGGAGVYLVSYTFGDLTATGYIEVLDSPTAMAAVASDYNGSVISCAGAADGEATATGGVQYNWSDGQTTAVASGLSMGDYIVTVVDINGCSASAMVTLDDPPAITLSTSSTPNTGMMDGTATVIATGGTGNYSYEWNTTPVQVTETATGLSEGTYEVIVTDANECTATVSVDVGLMIPLNGDSCDDAVEVNALFGGPLNEPQTSDLYLNTDYTSVDDPTSGWECFGDESLENTIWFSFVGDGRAFRIRSVECSATEYNGDTQVALYSGDCSTFTVVACNEDEDFASDIYNFQVDLVTEVGVDYLMMVDGWDGMVGEFCIEVTATAPNFLFEIGRANIDIYPNPTNGEIRLGSLQADRVEVINNLGQLQHSWEQPGSIIDVSGIPPGIYFLSIREGDTFYSARIIKE